ncbi:hypothetical protein CMK12_06650 [Candidatus Poribacteria bacterium]|jgi:chemotaxis signal transduction protein|nr:hypothetical protein [Candidatus Poribacteria bacterium]
MWDYRTSSPKSVKTITDIDMIMFRLGQSDLGALVEDIDQILQEDSVTIEALPNMPQFIQGIIHRQNAAGENEIVPVINLNSVYNLYEEQKVERLFKSDERVIIIIENASRRLGFQVTSLEKVEKIPISQIYSLPPIIKANLQLQSIWALGIRTNSTGNISTGDVVILVDLDQILVTEQYELVRNFVNELTNQELSNVGT